jgi:ELWxxDGT repeat protein
LVKDINTDTVARGSFPQWFTNHGSSATFLARGDQGRYAVWRTDGSEEGTVRIPLKCDPTCTRVWSGASKALYQTVAGDLWLLTATPGAPTLLLAGSRAVAAFESELPPAPLARGKLFFVAKSSATGRELWITDFTANGTRLVKDLSPGAADSLPTEMTWWQDRLYFFALRSAGDWALWKSDGTPAGTRLVFDFNPRSPDEGPDPQILGATAGGLVVNVWTPSRGLELWVTRGTGETTKPLPELVAGPESLGRALKGGGVEGRFVFAAGSKIVSTAGQGRAVLLPGEPWVAGRFLGAAGGRLVYQNASEVPGLWSTDGTLGGTGFLGAIDTRGPSAPLAGRQIVSARDSEGGLTLWSLGATDALELGRLCASNCRVTSAVRLGAEAMFVVGPVRGVDSPSLWTTTDRGTGASRLIPSFSGALETTLSGRALGWLKTESSGPEPVLVSSAGETSIIEINHAVEQGSSYAEPLAVVGDRFVFRTRLEREYELWSTDGSDVGTERLPGPGAGWDGLLSRTPVGDRLILGFGSFEFVAGRESLSFSGSLLAIGGNPLRSTVIAPGRPGIYVVDSEAPVVLGTRALFRLCDWATPSPTGCEPWTSDGTLEGTQVIDVEPGEPGSAFKPLVAFNGKAYGRGGDSASAWPGLWSSDGTVLGTGPVESPDEPVLSAMAPSEGYLYFVKSTDGCPRQLWRLDASTNAELVADLDPSCPGIKNAWMFAALHGVVLIAELNRGRYRVWFSDGSEAGTTSVFEGPRRLEYLPTGPLVAAFRDRFYFLLDFNQMWSIDGTPSGTRRESWWPGASVSFEAMLPIGDRLLVSASVDRDQALWWTDGTADGTQRLMSGSNPLRVGDRVFFTGVDQRGSELWVLEGFP